MLFELEKWAATWNKISSKMWFQRQKKTAATAVEWLMYIVWTRTKESATKSGWENVRVWYDSMKNLANCIALQRNQKHRRKVTSERKSENKKKTQIDFLKSIVKPFPFTSFDSVQSNASARLCNCSPFPILPYPLCFSSTPTYSLPLSCAHVLSLPSCFTLLSFMYLPPCWPLILSIVKLFSFILGPVTGYF